jgi:hypothetical protein
MEVEAMLKITFEEFLEIAKTIEPAFIYDYLYFNAPIIIEKGSEIIEVYFLSDWLDLLDLYEEFIENQSKEVEL